MKKAVFVFALLMGLATVAEASPVRGTVGRGTGRSYSYNGARTVGFGRATGRSYSYNGARTVGFGTYGGYSYYVAPASYYYVAPAPIIQQAPIYVAPAPAAPVQGYAEPQPVYQPAYGVQLAPAPVYYAPSYGYGVGYGTSYGYGYGRGVGRGPAIRRR
jgi:hypothetical protein